MFPEHSNDQFSQLFCLCRYLRRSKGELVLVEDVYAFQEYLCDDARATPAILFSLAAPDAVVVNLVVLGRVLACYSMMKFVALRVEATLQVRALKISITCSVPS